MRTTYSIDGKQVATGEISSLPGCSQVGVLHSAFVLPQHRGNGIGKLAHQNRLDIARENLYDYALCTVDSENEPQIKNLLSNGWDLLDRFESNKTGHKVEIWGRKL